MACFRIFLCAGLTVLALAPANLAHPPVGLHPVALAIVQDSPPPDEPATAAMLLGGAVILMVAGRRRRC